MNTASSTSAQPATRARASSNPLQQAANPASAPSSDFAQLRELQRTNPAAAHAAQALITAGHTITQAVAMMTSVMTAVPAPSVPSVQRPATPERRPPHSPAADAARLRREHSAPASPSPQTASKRARVDPASPSERKRTRQDRSSAGSSQRQQSGPVINRNAINNVPINNAWPCKSAVKLVRDLAYVDMWYFTKAGCGLAEKQRRDGTGPAMVLQPDMTFKAPDNPKGFKLDWELTPHEFKTATSLWAKVAERVGVRKDLVDSMLILNNEIIDHEEWGDNPKMLIKWHQHQRESWATADDSNGGRFPLEGLDPEHYKSLCRIQAMTDSSQAEARALALEAEFRAFKAAMLAPMARPRQDHRAEGFRNAGGSGSGSNRPGADHPKPAFAADRRTTTSTESVSPPLAATAPSPSSKPTLRGRTAYGSAREASACASATTPTAATEAAAPTAAHGAEPAHTAIRSVAPPLTDNEAALGPTPLDAEGWRTALGAHGLAARYPSIVSGIEQGFHVGLPRISTSFVPPNHNSARNDPDTVEAKIQKELAAGRYSGPLSLTECETLVGGPFQCSPISLTPKPPDGWRFIQDASFPKHDQVQKSINFHIDSDAWPCTYAGISIVIWQILRLPPTAEAAARDVRSAYRTIRLHPSQWPAAVVHWEGRFYIDKALAFGMASSAGAWGMVGDGLADILRAEGIGPVVKWVDDYLFFRVRRSALPAANAARAALSTAVRPQQRGGCLFWRLRDLELPEDFAFPLRVQSVGEADDWAYSFADVDEICRPLGVPWSEEKEQPFGSSVTYYGVIFNIPARTIALPETKRLSLLGAITTWLQYDGDRHTRDEAESLLGQLEFATHVVPNGRPYLAGLVKFLGMHARAAARPTARPPPAFDHVRLHPPDRVRRDLGWWHTSLSRPVVLRSFAGDRDLLDPPLYSDACDSGAGVVLGGAVAAYAFASGWRAQGRDIMWAEAVGAELGIRHLVASGVRDRRVRLYIDNTAVEAGFRHGRVRNDAANECLERVFHFASLHNVVFLPARVTSADNPADAPSRGEPSALPRLPALNLPPSLAPLVHRLW